MEVPERSVLMCSTITATFIICCMLDLEDLHIVSVQQYYKSVFSFFKFEYLMSILQSIEELNLQNLNRSRENLQKI